MKANQNILVSSIQLVFFDFVGDFFYFPIWWYTTGVKNAFWWFINAVKGYEYRLAVLLWIRNLFVPMFGQVDWQGRLISIFMRLVQILARGVALVIVVVVAFGVSLMWIVGPILVIYGIVINFWLVFE